VARVEVIKGDAARAQFGDEARNGVVQIFLKEGAKGSGRR
jgi:outer membrane cobalamin receptor